MNSLDLELDYQQKKNSLETETSLRDKLKRAEEKENSQHDYLWGVIFSTIAFVGIAIFIWYKQILDEYWYYGSGIFGALALIGLILSFFAYKWLKEAEKEVKELKKRLKDSV